ncbi:Protein CBG21476 [Caenorhabditis briggsae]|uniref:Protein CBG21476 n=1 Tax=Caenorhabditis briggsae TaxID=6238 RepID=A8Y046_CAEBR|nr:Protein CBG21476 [Caenorhabditis briggsae]CAP38264.1 Protein CBG21476 [Caenorhabditis briggsae]
MKHRDESGCIDFSQNEVKLRATGKELDDTISFFNNLTAQLKSAKQGGSYQQL